MSGHHMPRSKFSREQQKRTIRPCHLLTCVFLVLIWTQSRPLLESKKDSLENNLALSESLGFFNDIPNDEWRQMKAISQTRPIAPVQEESADRYFRHPNLWYATHWEPNFSCRMEQLVGGLDDGHKWVCDPHRITAEDCLVYSIGSRGNVRFETSIRQLLPHCEVHVFDPTDYHETISAALPSDSTHFHPWGLQESQNSTLHAVETLKNRSANRPAGKYRSLQETLKILGHSERRIDIFKIDCDECEWATFHDWLEFDIRQILVEVHDAPAVVDDFFQALRNAGYAIFHKEPNIENNPNCIEYSFLKLSKEFWMPNM